MQLERIIDNEATGASITAKRGGLRLGIRSCLFVWKSVGSQILTSKSRFVLFCLLCLVFNAVNSRTMLQ